MESGEPRATVSIRFPLIVGGELVPIACDTPVMADFGGGRITPLVPGRVRLRIDRVRGIRASGGGARDCKRFRCSGTRPVERVPSQRMSCGWSTCAGAIRRIVSSRRCRGSSRCGSSNIRCPAFGASADTPRWCTDSRDPSGAGVVPRGASRFHGASQDLAHQLYG